MCAGSLRLNLDPSNIFTEEKLWNCLEHSHLKEFVMSLDGNLEYELIRGGRNLR